MRIFRKASFSITALFVLVVLASSFISNYMLRKENSELKVENRNMANQLLDQYQLEDASQIHWSEIELPTMMVWRFRVYVPPGNAMQLNYAVTSASDSLPAPMRSFKEIIDGEKGIQTVTIHVRRLPSGMTKIDAFINGAFAHGCVCSAPPPFAWLYQLEELSIGFQSSPAAPWPNTASPDENVVLLKKSETELSNLPFGGNAKIANPPNQFTIWLEPVD